MAQILVVDDDKAILDMVENIRSEVRRVGKECLV